MDADIKSVLQEIVAELKERNEQGRAAAALAAKRSERADERLAEMKEKWGGDGDKPGSRMKEMMEKNEARMAQNEARVAESRERADKLAAERTEFQQDLLRELRRFNENFDAFINRGTSFL